LIGTSSRTTAWTLCGGGFRPCVWNGKLPGDGRIVTVWVKPLSKTSHAIVTHGFALSGWKLEVAHPQPEHKPLVNCTWWKCSLPLAGDGKLPRDAPSVTSCVKIQSTSPHTTMATNALAQEAGPVQKMPGRCVTSSIFRSRDFGTWHALGNWTSCVSRLSLPRPHLRCAARCRDGKPPRDGPSVESCVKPLSNTRHSVIATKTFDLTCEVPGAGQVRTMTSGAYHRSDPRCKSIFVSAGNKPPSDARRALDRGRCFWLAMSLHISSEG